MTGDPEGEFDAEDIPRRVRARVHGRVQGVFFRESTRRCALDLGLAGFVRNCEDGTVEVLIEGPADAVDELLAFVRVGPPRARVERVDVREEEYSGELVGFARLP